MLPLTTVFSILLALVPRESIEYRIQENRGSVIYRHLRAQRQKPLYDYCGIFGEQCVPSRVGCCEGFECKNKFGSLCLYPLEPCFCWAPPNKRNAIGPF